MTFRLVIGFILVGFGVLVLAARLFGWKALLTKRDSLKQRMGAVTGDVLHLIAYELMPIGIGLVLLNEEYGFW